MSANKWNTDQMKRQDGRVAIVTGANSGIGFEAARALAHKGARVVLACRSEERGREAARKINEETPDGSARSAALDLADLESVRGFAEAFVQENEQLDLLINNAGVMVPPASKTRDGFELQFGTNHLGHFALSGRLLPLLLATQESRIVTVASMAHRAGAIDFDDLNWEQKKYAAWSAYGQSKLANLLFTFELQRKLDAAGALTIATAAHPGWTATDLQRHSGMMGFLNPLFAMKPWQGALPTLYAATADDAVGGDYIGPGGWMEMRGWPRKVGTKKTAQDTSVAARLWSVSQEMTGVKFDEAMDHASQ